MNWKEGFEIFFTNSDYTIALSVREVPNGDSFKHTVFNFGSKNIVVTYGEIRLNFLTPNVKELYILKKLQ